MNLGFYVHNTSNTPLNQKVYTVLNEALDSGLVPDASLFYDEVDFISFIWGPKGGNKQ